MLKYISIYINDKWYVLCKNIFVNKNIYKKTFKYPFKITLVFVFKRAMCLYMSGCVYTHA